MHKGAKIYLSTFATGAVWFAAVALKMISRHSSPSPTYTTHFWVTLVVAWVVTALLLGVTATHFQKLRSWWGIGLGTVLGSFAVMGIMLFVVEQVSMTPPLPQFKTTDEMMVYLAGEATKWVKKDRDIDLDYSFESVKVIEEELGRIAKDVDGANPKPGTIGIAMGYGAYIGETFRRRDGGSWAVDHPIGGARSYPLTTRTNGVIFPVGWCWKRLTNGEEDNVYHKAMAFTKIDIGITNTAELK